MFVKSLLKSQLLPSLCSQTAQVNSSSSTRSVHSLPASFTRKNQWNRAVSEAEKLVGYPTSLVSVRALMDDDFANIAVHMRKLIGSDHPVLQTVKRLVYQGKNKMQVSGWKGHVMLGRILPPFFHLTPQITTFSALVSIFSNPPQIFLAVVD